MFTKFNQVLLASVLTVGSVILPLAVMAAPEAQEEQTSNTEIGGTMPVYRALAWVPAAGVQTLELEFNKPLSDANLGTVTYSSNGPNWKIAVYSDEGGVLKIDHATYTDTIDYTVSLACGAQGGSGTAIADVKPAALVGDATTVCSGTDVFADATANLTIDIVDTTGNTLKRAGDYSDNLYLIIKAQ
jgi:hypothetical protein